MNTGTSIPSRMICRGRISSATEVITRTALSTVCLAKSDLWSLCEVIEDMLIFCRPQFGLGEHDSLVETTYVSEDLA